jgi:hypothetical protein
MARTILYILFYNKWPMIILLKVSSFLYNFYKKSNWFRWPAARSYQQNISCLKNFILLMYLNFITYANQIYQVKNTSGIFQFQTHYSKFHYPSKLNLSTYKEFLLMQGSHCVSLFYQTEVLLHPWKTINRIKTCKSTARWSIICPKVPFLLVRMKHL